MEVEEELNFIAGSSSPNRTGDIVFVHGLRGHYKKTWHPQEGNLNSEQLEKDTNYFPYWLAEDITNVGIWSYRYRAEPSVWSAKFKPGDPELKGITMPLYDRAKNLIGVIKNNEVGQRPLVFMTHSLGGLIVKKMLRDAESTRENPDNQAIIDQTKGVVFIATPHQGSHLATILGWLGNFAQVTITGHELEENNPDLRDLNEWYRFKSEKPPINVKSMVFYETQPIPNFTGVVDASSANPYLSEQVELISVNANHISIAKPISKNATVYLGTRRFIKMCLPAPLSLPERRTSTPLQTFVTEGAFRQVEENKDPQ